MDERERARFAEGVRLFNAGEYLEAHEWFEELWMERGGEEAMCLKGLIQATVALHHATCANVSGARKLAASFRTYLRPECAGRLPFVVPAFVERVDACLDAWLAGGRSTRLDPADAPRLTLDWTLTE